MPANLTTHTISGLIGTYVDVVGNKVDKAEEMEDSTTSSPEDHGRLEHVNELPQEKLGTFNMNRATKLLTYALCLLDCARVIENLLLESYKTCPAQAQAESRA